MKSAVTSAVLDVIVCQTATTRSDNEPAAMDAVKEVAAAAAEAVMREARTDPAPDGVSGERRERVLLRPWLENLIHSGVIAGLEWIDAGKTMFKVPWKHRSKKNWSLRHSSVFLVHHLLYYVAMVTCETKLFQHYFNLRRCPSEILLFRRVKLFQNCFRSLLQLMINSNMFNVAEIIFK